MQKSELKNNKVAIALGIAITLFLIQFLPFILRNDVYIRIHDTLEGEWIWFSSVVDYGMALNYDMSARIETFLGGLPRYLFPTGLSGNVLLISLFGTIGGYLVNSFLIHLIGFIGCYQLFKQYVFKSEEQKHLPILIAALFSIIPLFITFGITVSGQPLLLLAFLNILNRKTRYWEFCYILLFPFWANLVYSALFVNLLVFVVFIYTYKKEYAKIKFFLMLTLMNITYLAVNYHLVYAMFISDVTLHRDEYRLAINEVPSILSAIGESAYLFFIGSYHVGTMVTFPIFIIACFNLGNKVVKHLLLLALAIAILNGFYIYLVPTLEKIHPIIISFNIKRIKVLMPIIWMAILAFSLRDMYGFKKGRMLSYFTLACLIVSTLFANDEILNNYRNMLGFQKKPDAHQFFASNTMQDIENYIDQDKTTYRVAHLGINPTISQYNGFLTIDGLQAMYPLSHKNLMKEIMKGELDKDYKLVRYFNAWGNRCYLFSSELGKENRAFMIDKNQDVKVEQWSINTTLLKQHNVKYIFSTATIGNAEELNLQFEKSFSNPAEFWEIQVYSLK